MMWEATQIRASNTVFEFAIRQWIFCHSPDKILQFGCETVGKFGAAFAFVVFNDFKNIGTCRDMINDTSHFRRSLK